MIQPHRLLLKNDFQKLVRDRLPEGVSLDDVEIWFQDEARVGQQGTLTRVWARKGTRPRLTRQRQFLNVYIYGAVCPEHDKAAALIMPHANTACMKEHLQEISHHVEKGKYAVVVIDQARWHVSKNLHVPQNILLLPLPPYSPELNPQENVWLYLRQNWLANRCFESLDDITDACCEAWNGFIGKAGAIRSLCSRSWAVLSD